MRLILRLLSLVALVAAVDLIGALPTECGVNDQDKGNHQVVVDVVVTDAANRPVRGLREQDFQVFENGKRQQIASFEAHEQRTETEIPAPPKLPENTFSNATASETGTVNVILLDEKTTSIENQELARRNLLALLKQKSPQSRFAIFVYRTGDVLCQSCDGLRMVEGITADRDELVAATQSRGAQPRPPQLQPQWQSQLVQLSQSQAQFPARYPPQPPIGWQHALFIEDTSMHALAEIGNFLKDLPGRKQLIWLSDNFDASPVAVTPDGLFPAKFKGWQDVDPLVKGQTLHLAASRLSLARVAVYPIDLSGRSKKIKSIRECEAWPWTSYAWSGPVTQSQLDSSFYECKTPAGTSVDRMAAETGGQAFHDGSRIEEAIAQAVTQGENYYTLTYTPTKEKLDDKVRTIRLAIDRKEYDVHYRERYFADDPSTVYRPGTETSPDIVLPGLPFATPWRVGRVPIIVWSVLGQTKRSRQD